jgi:formiminotetrahydrofolate cyclodeaminase
MSDAAVGALMAYAGIQGAVHNVRINLPHTKDPEFIAGMESELGDLLSESKAICEAVQARL